MSRGWEIIADFVEPGVTATDDRQPEFRRMIDAATMKPLAFDVILVHSFSRCVRDQFRLEFYVRRLAKDGVRLVFWISFSGLTKQASGSSASRVSSDASGFMSDRKPAPCGKPAGNTARGKAGWTQLSQQLSSSPGQSCRISATGREHRICCTHPSPMRAASQSQPPRFSASKRLQL